jgi:hypothetical protein
LKSFSAIPVLIFKLFLEQYDNILWTFLLLLFCSVLILYHNYYIHSFIRTQLKNVIVHVNVNSQYIHFLIKELILVGFCLEFLVHLYSYAMFYFTFLSVKLFKKCKFWLNVIYKIINLEQYLLHIL